MEILKNFSEAEMDGLKIAFRCDPGGKGLSARSFRRVMWAASQSKEELASRISKRFLRQLFDNIDVSGSGTVSWDDFTMFAIDQARTSAVDEFTDAPAVKRKRARARRLRRESMASRQASVTSKHASMASGQSSVTGSRRSVATLKGSRASLRTADMAADRPGLSARLFSSASILGGRMQGPTVGGAAAVGIGRRGSRSSSSSSSSCASDRSHHSRTSGRRVHVRVFSSDSDSDSATDGELRFEEFTAFREYHVDHIVPQRFGTSVIDMRLLPRPRKAVQLAVDLKGAHTMSVFDFEGQSAGLYGKVPKCSEALTAWDYVPVTGGVGHCNSLVCGYNGGLMRLYSLEKRRPNDELLPSRKAMSLSETQTALRWSSMYGRMMIGSRSGVVSTWDVDQDRLTSQEKLHTAAVTSLRIHSGGLLWSASLDNMNSVKGVDLERSVVRFSFNDHLIGGTLCLDADDEFYFSSGLEPRIVQRLLQSPRSSPQYLYDVAQPHKGCVSSLYRIPNSPVLVSGDTGGTLKLWDLRMGMCLQTVAAATLASSKHRVVAAGLEREEDTQETERKKVRRLRQSLHSDSEQLRRPTTDTRHPSHDGRKDRRAVMTSKPRVTTSRKLGRHTKYAWADGSDACIHSVCFMPSSNRLLVSTPREIVALSNDNTACPDLADDEQPCRFLLFSSDGQVLTVHERGVKLWDIATGYAVYVSSPDLTRGDISACTLVEPLRRQFLLGSMAGELRGFSLSLAQPTTDYTALLRETGLAGHSTQIVALHTLAQLRDHTLPYLVVVTAHGIALMPVIAAEEGLAASRVIPLQSVSSILEASGAVIRDTAINGGYLYVATTSNALLLLNLEDLGPVAATFSLPTASVIENIGLGAMCQADGMAATQRTTGRARSAASDMVFFFSADSTGKLIVGATFWAAPDGARGRSSPALEDGRPAVAGREEAHALLGDWPPCLPPDDQALAAAGSRGVGWLWFRQPSQYVRLRAVAPVGIAAPAGRSESAGLSQATASNIGGSEVAEVRAPVQRRPSFSVTQLAEELLVFARQAGSAREQQQQQQGDEPTGAIGRVARANVTVTHTHFFEEFGVLVTGDERGHVRIWDLAAVADAGQATASQREAPAAAAPGLQRRGSSRYLGGTLRGARCGPRGCEPTAKPVFVAGWEAHEKSLTALGGTVCDLTGLPIVVTAGADRRVSLWSADGVLLGCLAMGRLASEASNARRHDLGPYVLSEEVPLGDMRLKWSAFEAAMAARSAAAAAATAGLEDTLGGAQRRSLLGLDTLSPGDLQVTPADARRISAGKVSAADAQAETARHNAEWHDAVFVTGGPPVSRGPDGDASTTCIVTDELPNAPAEEGSPLVSGAELQSPDSSHGVGPGGERPNRQPSFLATAESLDGESAGVSSRGGDGPKGIVKAMYARALQLRPTGGGARAPLNLSLAPTAGSVLLPAVVPWQSRCPSVGVSERGDAAAPVHHMAASKPQTMTYHNGTAAGHPHADKLQPPVSPHATLTRQASVRKLRQKGQDRKPLFQPTGEPVKTLHESKRQSRCERMQSLLPSIRNTAQLH